MWSSESHITPFSSFYKCASPWVIGLAQGLWLLLHPGCWALTGTPLGILSVLCHGDPGALDLWDQNLHLLQQFFDGVDVGMGRLIALVLGNWVGQPTNFPSWTPQGQSLQYGPWASSQQAARSGSSFLFSHPRLTHLHPHYQGHLYCFAQSAWPALLPATGGKG